MLVQLMARLAAHAADSAKAAEGAQAASAAEAAAAATSAAEAGAAAAEGGAPAAAPHDSTSKAASAPGSALAAQNDAEAFNLLSRYCAQVTLSQAAGLELPDALSLQLALLEFAMQAYPARRDLADQVCVRCAAGRSNRVPLARALAPAGGALADGCCARFGACPLRADGRLPPC